MQILNLLTIFGELLYYIYNYLYLEFIYILSFQYSIIYLTFINLLEFFLKYKYKFSIYFQGKKIFKYYNITNLNFQVYELHL